MLQSKLSNKEYEIIYEASDYIKLIYGIPPKESVEYIFAFFIEDMFIEFEQPVKLIKEYFKYSFS